MNNIFNIKRFGLVLRKELMENWKRYMILFLTMLTIITIVHMFVCYGQYNYYKNLDHNSNPDKQITPYHTLINFSSVLFFIFGILFSSTFMNSMNSKVKKISYLSNPSSHLEKYLTRWGITIVGYIISFFIALFIADALRVSIYSTIYPNLNIKFIDLFSIWEDENKKSLFLFFSKEASIMYISFYLLFQSIFILGSTFWEKATFMKTIIAIVLIFHVFGFLCYGTILLFYGGFDAFGNVLNSFGPTFEKRDISDKQVAIYFSCIISFFTISNWIITYFRLRESEIIKRL